MHQILRRIGTWLLHVWCRVSSCLPKCVRFAVVGAIGCLCGAILGESLLGATRSAPVTSNAMGPRSICLVIDSSGSMRSGKLDEVRGAAKNFAQRQDLSRDRIGVVQFASDAKLAVPLTSDLGQIENAIDRLYADGSTAMNLGLQLAEDELSAAQSPQHILLFTDGQPTWPPLALSAARSVRRRGMQIIAIGTGDADRGFLSQLTGDPSLVLWAASGQFEDAFHAAERLIANASLLDASSGYKSAYALARTGAWTALLALGLGTSLIAAQNRYLRRPLFSPRDLLGGIGGCIIAGLLAGNLGQGLFWLARSDVIAAMLDFILLGTMLGTFCAVWFKLSIKTVARMAGFGAFLGLGIALGGQCLADSVSAWLLILLAVLAWPGVGAILFWTAGYPMNRHLSAALLRAGWGAGMMGISLLFLAQSYIGQAAMLLTDASTRLIGWSILGSMLGGGLSFFIPNLNKQNALIAGAASGILAATLYLTVGAHFDGFAARAIGALVFGFAMGLLIVIAEVASRDTWLEIAFSPQDRRTINLGGQAVTVGGQGASSGKRSDQVTYRVENGSVVCQEAIGRICRILPGQTRILGGTQVTVRKKNE